MDLHFLNCVGNLEKSFFSKYVFVARAVHIFKLKINFYKHATQCLVNCSGFIEIKIDADFNALNEYGWN